MEFQIEKDMLGERQVPKDAYYGIQTIRALENFPITGIPISHFPNLIRALAFVKKAAVITNFMLGLLNEANEEAIITACNGILAGRLHEHFVVDVIQGSRDLNRQKCERGDCKSSY